MKNEFESLPQAEQEAVLQTMKEMEKLRASPPRFDPNVDLHTVTMTELYDTVFPPKTPLIDGLLYSGTYTNLFLCGQTQKLSNFYMI